MKVMRAFIGAVLVLFGVVFLVNIVSALTFQTSVGIEFNFDPVLAVTLSNDALLIDNLAPGSTASSNTITVTVDSNNPSGYTLSAAVGDGTTYTNNSLTNLASPANPQPTFTSIPANVAAVASLSSDNTWGFTLDSANYYGLAYLYSVSNNEETWTVLNATKDAVGTAATSGCVGTCAGTSTTTFAIGAKASAMQSSGDYTNIIQFKVVSNAVPSTYAITYNSSTTDIVSSMPTNVSTSNISAMSVALSSAVPSRTDYHFLGWCTTETTDTPLCSGDLYNAGDSVPIVGGKNNVFTLYALWSDSEPLSDSVCPANSICYAPNADDIVGSMSSLPQTATDLTNASSKAGAISATANSTTSLIASNFARSGYGFAGWSADYAVSNASIIYGPNETISTDPSNGGADVSSGLILYPVWVASAGNLQGWTDCSLLKPVSYDLETGDFTVSLKSITALTDTRDNNVYTVARLADGLCWMVENLRLNAENTRGVENMAKAKGYRNSSTLGAFIGLADSEDANFWDTYPPVANSLYSTNGANNTINIGTSYYPENRIPRYNNNNTNMSSNATNSDGSTTLVDGHSTNDNHSRWYSYGNYYNWPAAIASTSNYTYTNVIMDNAICPSGWSLPSGLSYSDLGSFAYLDVKMGGTGLGQTGTHPKKWRVFPNNFVYSGRWSDNSAYDRGSEGRYWSFNPSNNTDYAYGLSLSDIPYVYPGTTDAKYAGSSVRCLIGL